MSLWWLILARLYLLTGLESTFLNVQLLYVTAHLLCIVCADHHAYLLQFRYHQFCSSHFIFIPRSRLGIWNRLDVVLEAMLSSLVWLPCSNNFGLLSKPNLFYLPKHLTQTIQTYIYFCEVIFPLLLKL